MPIYKRAMKQLGIRVEDLMASPPVTTSDRSTIEGVAVLMWDKKVGSVMVVNKSGKLVGIVTERDLIFAVARSMIGKKIPVSSVMSKNLITIAPEEDAVAAIEKMRQSNVRHLPVMKSGRPVGIVSIRDVLDAGASMLKILLQAE